MMARSCVVVDCWEIVARGRQSHDSGSIGVGREIVSRSSEIAVVELLIQVRVLAVVRKVVVLG